MIMKLKAKVVTNKALITISRKLFTKGCNMVFTEELTSSANLRVTPSKEPLFTRKLDILEVTEGRAARFDCKVSGSPTPKVTWMHFGKNLSLFA